MCGNTYYKPPLSLLARLFGGHSQMNRTLSFLVGFHMLAVAQVLGAIHCFPSTPYFRIQDSPFDLSGLGTTFFLENMESGVSQVGGS